mgnify:CR=1 FL=1
MGKVRKAQTEPEVLETNHGRAATAVTLLTLGKHDNTVINRVEPTKFPGMFFITFADKDGRERRATIFWRTKEGSKLSYQANSFLFGLLPHITGTDTYETLCATTNPDFLVGMYTGVTVGHEDRGLDLQKTGDGQWAIINKATGDKFGTRSYPDVQSAKDARQTAVDDSRSKNKADWLYISYPTVTEVLATEEQKRFNFDEILTPKKAQFATNDTAGAFS